MYQPGPNTHGQFGASHSPTSPFHIFSKQIPEVISYLEIFPYLSQMVRSHFEKQNHSTILQTIILNHTTSINASISRKLFLIALRCISGGYKEC